MAISSEEKREIINRIRKAGTEKKDVEVQTVFKSTHKN